MMSSQLVSRGDLSVRPWERTVSLPLASAGMLLGALLVTSGQAAEEKAAVRLESAFAVNRPARVRDGRFYTPFYDYVIGPHAVAARGKVYCTFQNADGQPIAMAYDVADESWVGPVKASEFGLEADAHGNPALVIDGQGHLHIFYGCHGGPMRHTRSAWPYDVGSWVEQAPPTPRATYPQTMRMADGTLRLFYRAGGHMEPWSLRTSSDDGRTWSEAEKIIEMRLDPPDRLAAAYCQFFPGAGDNTIHCFWNHKDDNAARVTDARKHPWRPLKYKGLHEAVYRYNVYYVHRGADGVWRNAADLPVRLPVSKLEADTKCLVYDSGDEFSFVGGTRQAVDADDRPCIKFGVGVVNWATVEKKVIVPVRHRFARLESGEWRIHEQLPADWPEEVVAVIRAPGPAVYGGREAVGWSIFCRRSPLAEGAGGSVFLHHARTGYATHPGGPARVP